MYNQKGKDWYFTPTQQKFLDSITEEQKQKIYDNIFDMVATRNILPKEICTLDIEKLIIIGGYNRVNTNFTGKCFVLRHNNPQNKKSYGRFCYGEDYGNGFDFEDAEKWNSIEDAKRYILHNEEYDNSNWKIFEVKINYEIVE